MVKKKNQAKLLPDEQETTSQGKHYRMGLSEKYSKNTSLFLDNLPADFFLENRIHIFNMQIRM